MHRKEAQMAESVDALVSNTSGAIHPGSIPGLGTQSGEQIVLLPAFLCSLATQLLSLPVDKLKYLAARIDSKVFPFAISKI